jgi:hypothetical protein
VDDAAVLLCARCGTELAPGQGSLYVVRIEAFADPTPPHFTAEDLVRDAHAEIEHLVEQLRGLSERELMDQVYRQMVLYFCGPCYRAWIENPAG